MFLIREVDMLLVSKKQLPLKILKAIFEERQEFEDEKEHRAQERKQKKHLISFPSYCERMRKCQQEYQNTLIDILDDSET